jgi:hypothetical protein
MALRLKAVMGLRILYNGILFVARGEINYSATTAALRYDTMDLVADVRGPANAIALSPSGKEGTTNFLTVRPRLCPHLTDALALESKAVNAAANDIAVKSRAALMAQASYFQLAGSLNNCLAAGVTAVKN